MRIDECTVARLGYVPLHSSVPLLCAARSICEPIVRRGAYLRWQRPAFEWMRGRSEYAYSCVPLHRAIVCSVGPLTSLDSTRTSRLARPASGPPRDSPSRASLRRCLRYRLSCARVRQSSDTYWERGTVHDTADTSAHCGVSRASERVQLQATAVLLSQLYHW